MNRLGLVPFSRAVRALWRPTHASRAARRGLAKCAIRRVEGCSTPTHFSRCGLATISPPRPPTGDSSHLLLFKSKVYVCQVAGGVPSFPAVTSVTPTLNNNTRLHLLDGRLVTLGGSSYRKTNLQTQRLLPPEGDAVVKAGQEWGMQTMASIGETFQKMEQTAVGGKLVVVGSTYYDEINENPCGVYVYSPEADLWERLECDGEGPEERSNLIPFEFDGQLCVLAPTPLGSYCLHTLDLEEREWRRKDLGVEDRSATQIPLVRSGASVSVLGDRLVLFGGSQLGAFVGDVGVLNLRNTAWETVEWTTAEPIGRTSHMTVPISQHQLLTFGGDTNHIGRDDHVEVLTIE